MPCTLLQQRSKTKPDTVWKSGEVAQTLRVDLVVVAGFVDHPKDGTHDGQCDCNAKPNLENEK